MMQKAAQPRGFFICRAKASRVSNHEAAASRMV
jgi:hypothetical protein